MRVEVSEELIHRVVTGVSIPPKPELLTRVQALMQEDYPSLPAIADVIASDVGISAAVLKMINSPYFGLARTVADIKQAVMFLGFAGVNSLLTGLLIRKAFEGKGCSIALEPFWDRAAEVGQVAFSLAKRLGLGAPEQLYTLGLFHDSGIPVLAMKHDNYDELLKRAHSCRDTSLVELEEEQYQVSHSVVGYYLASSWGLPKEICQQVLCHHELSYLDPMTGSEDESIWATLKLAEHIVSQQSGQLLDKEWGQVKENLFSCLELDEDSYADLLEDMEGIALG